MKFTKLLILVILIVSFSFLLIFQKSSITFEPFGVTYYKCKKYGNNQLTNSVFNKEGIIIYPAPLTWSTTTW